MALFPGETVALAFEGVSDVRNWAGLSEAAWLAVTDSLGSIGDHIRNVSLLPAAVLRGASVPPCFLPKPVLHPFSSPLYKPHRLG